MRFTGTFSRETIARYVGEASRRLTRYLPVPSLTAQFAADRLSALATAQALVPRDPEVLFVCVQNAGRSQIAAALLRALGGNRVHVRTAGSEPASIRSPDRGRGAR